MAVLDETNRAACHGEVMRRFRELGAGAAGETSLSKAQIRAVVDALDDYLNSTAADANQAIPLPQRTTLTSAQKAFITTIVITRRWIAGA